MRTLREVASRGTVAGAAKALHLTGPAVSQQLSVLEREAGTTLIERDGRSVRLTDAARTLVAHTEVILAQMEAAESDLASGEAAFGGALTVGCFPSAIPALVPSAIASLRHAAPDLVVHVREVEPEEALGKLRTGELDIAVAHEYDRVPRRADSAVHRTTLLTEPLLLALPEDHVVGSGDVALADLADDPRWIAPPEGLTCRDEVQRLCAAAGFAPLVTSVTYTYEATLALVAAGGVALVPRLATGGAPAGVRCIAPSDVRGSRRIFAAVRRGAERRPAVATAVAALLSAAEASSRRLHGVPDSLFEITLSERVPDAAPAAARKRAGRR